jgi:hypothetical protein
MIMNEATCKLGELVRLRAQVARLTACAKFVVWAVNDGPWQGGDLDGLSVQEKAEELGLIAETKFDPAIHKASDWVTPEPGEPWFSLDPDIVALTSTEKK